MNKLLTNSILFNVEEINGQYLIINEEQAHRESSKNEM